MGSAPNRIACATAYLEYMKSSPPSPVSCVLCKTCENYTGQPMRERRKQFHRYCAAKLVLGPDIYSCESYVALPIPAARPRDPHSGTRRRNAP